MPTSPPPLDAPNEQAMLIARFRALVEDNRNDGFNPDAAFIMASKQDPAGYQAWLREAPVPGASATRTITKSLTPPRSDPMTTVPPPSAGDQLIRLAKLYEQTHGCTPTTAQTAIAKAHPDLVARQRHEHLHPERPMPVAKAEPLTYADIRQTVEVYKAVYHVTTDDAWCALLDEDVPWHGDVEKAYRHWQRYEAPAERRAPVEVLPPLTEAQLRKMVRAMPDPPTTPSMDFLRMRVG